MCVRFWQFEGCAAINVRLNLDKFIVLFHMKDCHSIFVDLSTKFNLKLCSGHWIHFISNVNDKRYLSIVNWIDIERNWNVNKWWACTVYIGETMPRNTRNPKWKHVVSLTKIYSRESVYGTRRWGKKLFILCGFVFVFICHLKLICYRTMPNRHTSIYILHIYV